MIFVTVGTQLPFDRMIRAVDGWAAAGTDRKVFAQIGPTELRPANIDAQAFMSPSECRELIQAADVVVAHAGMGTILAALELGTPVLIMPRQAALGEHRNDHQLATARWFAKDHNVTVAFDAAELVQKLDQIEGLSAGAPISEYAGDGLIRALRSFIDGQPQNLADAA